MKLYQADENAHLMVCGDFNARIGELNVLIDDDSDFFGDGVCRDNTRKSQDKNTRQDTKTGNRPRPKDSDSGLWGK